MSLIPADGRIGMFSNGEYTEKGNLTFVRSVFQGLRNAISPRTNNAESPRRYVQHPQPLFVFQSEARMYIDTHQEDVFIAVHLSGGSKIAKF